jgi:hypothetical protein
MSNDRRQIVEALTEERAGLVCPAALLLCVSLVFDGGVVSCVACVLRCAACILNVWFVFCLVNVV